MQWGRWEWISTWTAPIGGTAAPTLDGLLEVEFFADQPPQPRDLCLYLPLYHTVEVEAVGVAAGATLAPPSRFALPQPLVIYGSSITQGGCASRSGACYPAVLARALHLDFVNLAFSGHGTGSAEMAKVLAGLDACAYLLDYGQNVTDAAALEQVYGPFLDCLRAARPGVPILCLSPQFVLRERHCPRARARLAGLRAAIRDCVAARALHDPHLTYVDGLDLLGAAEAECLTDGVHPGDRGFFRIADRLRPLLAQALGLSDGGAPSSEMGGV